MGKIEKMSSLTDWERELALLENKSNLRKLPVIRHLGKEVEVLLPTLFFLPLHPLGC